MCDRSLLACGFASLWLKFESKASQMVIVRRDMRTQDMVQLILTAQGSVSKECRGRSSTHSSREVRPHRYH
jgi:hypothetical protein